MRLRHGFRRFWLALAPTICEVRNIEANNQVVAVFRLDEGDGLVLPEPYLRVDHNYHQGGELIPMGSRASLEWRSREILTRRQMRGKAAGVLGFPLLVNPSLPPGTMELHG